MLQVHARRASEGPGNASSAIDEPGAQSSSRLRTTSLHNHSMSRPVSLSWNNRAATDPTHSEPVTKKQSRFASLFISMLAVSPVGVDFEATDEQTMESAQKASTAQTTPVPRTPPKKAYVRPVNGVKPSDIRKTRWKRFKYEVGLKIRARGKGKGKRQKLPQTDEVELDRMN